MINSHFYVLTDPSALDMSVLGRDLLNLFALIVDRPGDRVCLLGQPTATGSSKQAPNRTSRFPNSSLDYRHAEMVSDHRHRLPQQPAAHRHRVREARRRRAGPLPPHGGVRRLLPDGQRREHGEGGEEAAELGQDTQAYCDDMARQFREVWDALDISYDDFVQTSQQRHKQCCRKFIQKVYDNGYICKGKYEGWYCDGCEEFKTEKEVKEANGSLPAAPGRRRLAAASSATTSSNRSLPIG